MSKYAPESPPDEAVFCDVCGFDPIGGCECPECPVCTSAGDPVCMVSGGPGCDKLSEESKKALRAVARAAQARLLGLVNP